MFNDDAGGNVNDSNSITTNVGAVFGPAITALARQPVNGSTVELQGTGITVGDTIDLYADGNANMIVGTGTVLADGTFDITTAGNFADAVHTFVAQETNDPNLPESQPFTVDVDPNAPSITALLGQPGNGDKIELQGTGETQGDTIDLYVDGNTHTIVGIGTVKADGSFDIITSATFADGVHTFTATETDSSDLTSAQSSPALTVDVDPSVPAIKTLVGQPLNGGTVELQGTGETQGDTIDLYADGTSTIVGSSTVEADGSFDIISTATFADGVHTFTATETDGSSLTSAASSPAFTVDVDPTAPVDHDAGRTAADRADGRIARHWRGWRHGRSLCRQHQHDCRQRHCRRGRHLRYHDDGDVRHRDAHLHGDRDRRGPPDQREVSRRHSR